MISETAEVDLQSRESPFWGNRENLLPEEKLALQGIIGLEDLVEKKSREQLSNFKLDYFATDLYEIASEPFGHPSRSYRQDNNVITGGGIEYPDYHFIPRLMKELGEKATSSLEEAERNPGDVAKAMEAARHFHEMIYIHPFRDLNGRIARGLVHFALRRLGYLLPQWGFEARGAYLDAVSEGVNNPEAFDTFLARALLSSYESLDKKFDEVESEELDMFRRIQKSLNEFVTRSVPQTV